VLPANLLKPVYPFTIRIRTIITLFPSMSEQSTFPFAPLPLFPFLCTPAYSSSPFALFHQGMMVMVAVVVVVGTRPAAELS